MVEHCFILLFVFFYFSGAEINPIRTISDIPKQYQSTVKINGDNVVCTLKKDNDACTFNYIFDFPDSDLNFVLKAKNPLILSKEEKYINMTVDGKTLGIGLSKDSTDTVTTYIHAGGKIVKVDERLLKNFTSHKVHIAPSGTISIEDENKDHIPLSIGELKPEKNEDFLITRIGFLSENLTTPYEVIFKKKNVGYDLDEILEGEKENVKHDFYFEIIILFVFIFIFVIFIIIFIFLFFKINKNLKQIKKEYMKDYENNEDKEEGSKMETETSSIGKSRECYTKTQNSVITSVSSVGSCNNKNTKNCNNN